METRTDIRWTTRQREVLDLLVRGRTNAQIGEALGISVDGAKWHVNEILAKLDINSRDDAAEYWRRHQGLPQRLRRAIGGVPLLRPRPAAIGVIACLAAISALSLVFLLARVGPPPEDTEQTPSPTAPAVSPTTTPGATPAPVATVAGNAGTVGASVPFPENTILYLLERRGREGGSLTLVRAWRQQGPTHVETLLSPALTPDNAITGVVVDPATNDLWASECFADQCQYLGVSPQQRTRFLRSRDGGLTWAVATAVLDGKWDVIAVDDGDPVARSEFQTDGQPTYVHVLSGSAVSSPASVTESPQQWTEREYVTGAAIEPLKATLAWPDRSGNLYAPDGHVLLSVPVSPGAPIVASQLELLPTRPDYLVLALQTPRSETRASVVAIGDPQLLPTVWPLPVAISSPPQAVILDYSKGGPRFGTGLDGLDSLPRSIVTMPVATQPDSPEPIRNRPAIFDWGTGQLSPITIDPSEAVLAGSSVTVIGGSAQNFVVVKGLDGDCLNVRLTPSTSAQVVDCYREGVLLHPIGKDGAPDGWWPVYTPDGRAGWVATQYIQVSDQ